MGSEMYDNNFAKSRKIKYLLNLIFTICRLIFNEGGSLRLTVSPLIAMLQWLILAPRLLPAAY